MVKKTNIDAKSVVSRRQFGAAASVAAVAAGTPSLAMAANSAKHEQIAENTVSVMTKNGPVDAFFTRPAKGKFPGVLTWRGQAGLDVSSRQDARRLASKGYSVLVLDRDSAQAETIEADAHDAVAWLEKDSSVDEARGIGTPEWAEDRLKSNPVY